MNIEGGAEATAVKEEAEGKLSLYGIVIANAKADVYLGAVGTSAGLAAYMDETNYSGTVKLTGRFAFIVGIGREIDFTIALKPLREFFW